MQELVFPRMPALDDADRDEVEEQPANQSHSSGGAGHVAQYELAASMISAARGKRGTQAISHMERTVKNKKVKHNSINFDLSI